LKVALKHDNPITLIQYPNPIYYDNTHVYKHLMIKSDTEEIVSISNELYGQLYNSVEIV